MSASEGPVLSLDRAAPFFANAGLAAVFATAFFLGAALADGAFAFGTRFLVATLFDSEAATGEFAASSAGIAPANCILVFFGTVVIGSVRNRSTVSGLFASWIFANGLRGVRFFAYGSRVRHFVFRWIVTTIAVVAAAWLVPGIAVDGTSASIGAALLLGIFNAFIRPVLLLLSAPLILLSLGLFILVVNGLLLMLVPTFVPGFHVDGFGSAFWGAIVIGIVSWMLSAFFRGSDGRVHVLTHHAQVKRVQGRVIEPNEKTSP